MKSKLYKWQNNCLERWKKNGCKGICNVVTGAGKTVLAIAAIKTLEEERPDKRINVKIIVPKTFLLRQWRAALIEHIGAARDEIGVYGGTHKDSLKKYMIYVINSARYSLTKHILDDIEAGYDIFLIADECHHYGTEQNSRVFDYVKYIKDNAGFFTLGLSATPYCKNFDSILVPALGKEIYSFTFYNALKDEIISNFAVFNIGLSFCADERAEYDELSDSLSIAILRLNKRMPWLCRVKGQKYFAVLEGMVSGDTGATSDNESRELAKSILYLSFMRKEIVYGAKARISCVIDLVGMANRNSKIIIFGERIEMARDIYDRLLERYPNEIGLYHSGLNKNVATSALRRFESHETRILVSCRTLDEGLNISETDIGIIASSTGSKRQRIQRLGRVLRKKSDKRPAYLYYLFVENTSEEDEMLNETSALPVGMVNVIDAYYDADAQSFYNPYYNTLISRALERTPKHLWDVDKIDEFLKNAALGLLSCDWLVSEESCLSKINACKSKAEKNYYIAMLLLVRAASNR